MSNLGYRSHAYSALACLRTQSRVKQRAYIHEVFLFSSNHRRGWSPNFPTVI
jgi:hypothetical protein